MSVRGSLRFMIYTFVFGTAVGGQDGPKNEKNGPDPDGLHFSSIGRLFFD